jgi:hypothetical protein
MTMFQSEESTMNWLKKMIVAMILALPASAMAAGIPAKLYKNPSCGCCEEYAKYLRANGFEVEVVATHDLPMLKQEHNVPSQLEGCHTTLIGNYVVEGHVPVESINKLLQERPLITGISVPGMPAGSPGMGGEKKEPLKVYAIGTGEPRVYAIH